MRRAVAKEGFRHAIAEGWQAKGLFGHCAVTLLHEERGGRWRSYVRWVSGFEPYHDVPPPWSLDLDGERWGVDDPRPGPPPRSNATVRSDGTLRLLEDN